MTKHEPAFGADGCPVCICLPGALPWGFWRRGHRYCPVRDLDRQRRAVARART